MLKHYKAFKAPHKINHVGGQLTLLEGKSRHQCFLNNAQTFSEKNFKNTVHKHPLQFNMFHILLGWYNPLHLLSHCGLIQEPGKDITIAPIARTRFQHCTCHKCQDHDFHLLNIHRNRIFYALTISFLACWKKSF